MSAESEIRRFYDALRDGDADAAAGALDAEVVWVEPDAGLPPPSGSGAHHGLAAVRAAVLEPVAAPDAPWRVELERLVPADGLVVVMGHLVGRPRDGHPAPRCRFVHVWTMAAERATRVEVWIDPLIAARARLAPHPLSPSYHPERL